jgi:hypothetical protein
VVHGCTSSTQKAEAGLSYIVNSRPTGATKQEPTQQEPVSKKEIQICMHVCVYLCVSVCTPKYSTI